ncbi:hypothetical protein [Mycolicibacter hiberniae]|uniref:Peptidoglycan-binding protein ArfA BON-like domain-containing protein n=1 Tax=Mycolicibacter hiberniae TaxID=29314 RepID=A0A7I7WWL2_9MYCO|nr:hypothetical protein [Mycolicibacter hiberniae]MCV7086817.1 hypothetical protein [Mycolicibacter hiberniae]ORV70929.1 hypothetical protein AWC09_08520 [Mycolicibacter hiberniae]BBZ21884.1 hypothetical protein MHIB_03020 [Mycolicibacter hiberniae]
MRARLIATALATALLAAIGYGLLQRAPQPVADPELAAGRPEPVAVIRRGSEVTLAGDVADPAARRALLDAVYGSSEDLTVVDRLGVTPAAPSIDLSGVGPVFEAAAAIDDFTVAFDGATVRLGGTAAIAGEAAAVGDAAQDAWGRDHVVNDIATGSQRADRPAGD